MASNNSGKGKATSSVRRVVTGVDADGKSVIVGDGPPPREAVFESLDGMRFVDVWHLDEAPKDPGAGGDLAGYANLVPPPGGVHWRLTVFPPSTLIDPANLGNMVAELNEKLPDWTAHFDMTRLGMHRTDTIDFGVVISGEVWLKLDKGEVRLKQGDCVVQRGTVHAWNNRSDTPCLVSFVLLRAGSQNGV